MRLKRRAFASCDVNMVPMIDCVFQLIIFFLVAMQVKGAPDPVSLPVAVHPADIDVAETPLVVSVQRSSDMAGGLFVVNGQDFDAAGLRALLRAQADYRRRVGLGAPLVRVRADRESELRELRQCLLACREAGVNRVRLAAFRGGLAQEDAP